MADGTTARQQVDIVMDALHNPNITRPAGEWIGGEVARQFWLNAIRSATSCCQRRFMDAFQPYINAVVQQAEDRTKNHIRNVQSYLEIRRDTVGVRPAFAICELYMNIPEEVIRHSVIAELTNLCIDMVIIGNDLCSYNVEQARGDDGHNLVTIVMHEFQTDVQSAINWISDLHGSLVSQFLDKWKEIPTFGDPIANEVHTYVDGLGNWVRANDSWSFESERYFGKHGLEIQGTRPELCGMETGPQSEVPVTAHSRHDYYPFRPMILR
ncbi:terpene cyclase [Taiwanofungus camphoratus]|nr:terpene cyclase [Antrodia cinnamomea]